MDKRTRQRLEKALAGGTIPCALCRREHPRDADTISHGRCVNRAACIRRVRVPGALPKFVTFEIPPTNSWGVAYSIKHRMKRQEAEYHRVMKEQREARRPDLVVA